MSPTALSLPQRLLLRWPLLLALAFTIYSAALLSYAFDSWQRMRQDANNFLVADNQRRAASLADLAGDMRNAAEGHADIHELRAYLSNRDLGMSPRYGLNAGLAAIEARFQQLADQAGQRWASGVPYIAYYSADGEVLADSAPGATNGVVPPKLSPKTRLAMAPGSDAMVVAVPVIHKGRVDGTVVTTVPVAALLRNLLTANASNGYRELLLTAEGGQLRERGRDIKLGTGQRRLLAGLPDNVVLPAAQTLGAPFDGAMADDVLLVKTTVPGMPLVLITFVPEKMAYGHLVSRHVLRGAGILLLLMLLGAFKLERMRQRTAQLEADVAAVERERAVVEFRNVELSAEIRRREAAEERISDRNEQLNTIFELSPDGFVSFDEAYRVKYANPALLRMTGYAERDLVGLDEAVFSERLAKDCVAGTRFVGIAALRAAMHAAATDGAGETAPHGQSRLLVELAVPGAPVIEVKLRLARAATVSQILYFRDVTQEVEVDRMKSEFLSHAAHELRTPMASIYGFSELLMTQEFDEATRKDLLATIHKQTQWLVDIINELLDLARIEARRGMDFRIEPVLLPPLLAEVVAGMRIDPSHWPLATDCADNLPIVHADAAKLRQALSNVLGNAVKYSPEGGAIKIRCSASDRDGKHFIGIAVTDHGIGMRPDQVARVGERFYRADTSGKIPGTGLGMAIVKEIIELHGGGFTVVSAIGAGTTVTLWLPAEPHPATERSAA